jgi:hypothetical protein
MHSKLLLTAASESDARLGFQPGSPGTTSGVLPAGNETKFVAWARKQQQQQQRISNSVAPCDSALIPTVSN